MEIMQATWAIGPWLAIGALTIVTVARWWYGRQLQRLWQRVGRLHAERDTLREQVKQARPQLVDANKQLAAHRHTAAQLSGAGQVTPSARPKSIVSPQPVIPSGLVYETPQTAGHGFAETRPFHHINDQA